MDITRRTIMTAVIPMIAVRCCGSERSAGLSTCKEESVQQAQSDEQWAWLTFRGAKFGEIGILCREHWVAQGAEAVLRNGFFFRSFEESARWIKAFSPPLEALAASQITEACQRVVDLGVDATFSDMVPIRWKVGAGRNDIPILPSVLQYRVDSLFGMPYLESIELVRGTSIMVICQWLDGMTWRERMCSARLLMSADEVLWKSTVQEKSQLYVFEGAVMEADSPLVPLSPVALQRLDWLGLKKFTPKPLLLRPPS